MLIEHYGFPPENIVMLVDQGESHGTPTGGAIKRKLAELVAASQPGDTLVLHYSGHGTQVFGGKRVWEQEQARCLLFEAVSTPHSLSTHAKNS
jgi:hypothetical protein